jgi:hypothetical protein
MCCAPCLAAKLQSEGVSLDFIWDEGGTVYSEGVPPFTHLPVALVATAEKLYQASAGWHQHRHVFRQRSA